MLPMHHSYINSSESIRKGVKSNLITLRINTNLIKSKSLTHSCPKLLINMYHAFIKNLFFSHHSEILTDSFINLNPSCNLFQLVSILVIHVIFLFLKFLIVFSMKSQSLFSNHFKVLNKSVILAFSEKYSNRNRLTHVEKFLLASSFKARLDNSHFFKNSLL